MLIKSLYMYIIFFILRSRLELIEDTHKNKESRQVLIKC